MGQSFSAEPVVEKHTETDRDEIFDAAVSSCQGWRFSQEDDHSLKLELPGEHKASFFAVFDGHGSAKVSKHAADALWRHLTQNEMYIKGNFKAALEESFLTFDREVYESYNAQLAGTTAVCVLIVDNVIYCANIGDSRSVAAVNCECIPLSHDHKPENPLELKRILAAGGYVFGNRVNGNLALSRAFGDFHYKSNEQLPPDQQIVSPFPEIKRIELTDDVDFIVLACDGIWDVLTSEEVVNFVITRLEQEVRPDQICEQLTTRCLATDYELVIGCDNMTVLLVCYTRGRNWTDYCTDIFTKNSKRLGLPNRPRVFDNNFGNELNDGLATTTSSDLSRDSAMNNTFVNYDTSSSTADTTDASSFRSVGGASGARGRDFGDLFDTLVREISTTSATNSDDTPPITEVPAEEVETIHDPIDVSSTSQQVTDETVVEMEAKSTTEDRAAAVGQNERSADEGQELQSSGTTEVHLSSPEVDETVETGAPDAQKDSDKTQENESGAEGSAPVEVQLLDDEGNDDEGLKSLEDADPEDNKIGDTDTPAINEDEQGEDVDGIAVEEPATGEGNNEDDSQAADESAETATASESTPDDAADSSAADNNSEDA